MVQLADALADLAALGLDEGEGHAAPNDDFIDAVHQALQNINLAGHFGSAYDGQGWLFATDQHAVYVFNFRRHHIAKSTCSGEVLGHNGGARVRTVSGAKRIVHVTIAVLGQFSRKGFIPCFFAGVKTDVFKKKYVPIFEGCHGCIRFRTNGLFAKRDGLTEA